MPKVPQKPQHGQPAIKALYNSICDIIDYLPSLEVKGDQKSTYVTKSAAGTVIHANQPTTPTLGHSSSNIYAAGSGLYLSGNIFNVDVDGRTVQIVNNKLSAIGGGGGTIIIEDNFGVPNLSALNYNNEPPSVSGNGITWIIPVTSGQQITYSTSASGNVNASYAPAKGKSGNSFPINRDVLSTIPQDGYVRITAFDDGLHQNQCLRVLDGTTDWNKGLPLYKFSNFGSGAASAIQYTGISPISVNNENHTISFTGSTGGQCSGLGHPDYEALRNENGAYANVSGQGISFLLPVEKGQNYQFYAPSGDGKVLGTYAASLETGLNSYRTDAIANGHSFTPAQNGWVRISVFDDGSLCGQCLKFYKNKAPTVAGMPLYRFKEKQQRLSGDGVTIAVGDDKISGLYTGDGTTIGISNNVISAKYVGDGSKIKVQGNTISWIGGDIGGGFKAPDYAKLSANPDDGETAIGLGNTYVVPIKQGSVLRCEADGGTIVARWAPVEGSTGVNGFDITSTNSNGTSTDGYARVSVIDAGTLSAGCVKLYVDNNPLPLHKFALFNYSSGAIYADGRYTTIQTTETVEGVETPLENPKINNMLTGGTWITIQEEENNVALTYPRINCTLTKGTNIDITTGGVINCTLTGLDQLQNTPGYITNASVPEVIPYFAGSGLTSSALLDANNKLTGIQFNLSSQFCSDLSAIGSRTANKVLSSNTRNELIWTENTAGSTLSSVYELLEQGPNIKLTKLANGKTEISGTAEGSGGGTTVTSGIPWPNYENLGNDSSSISVNTTYVAGDEGGWLRISYKGQPTQQDNAYCYYVQINSSKVGMYTLNSTLSTLGNTWIIPIPPRNQFKVCFPEGPTHAYFDRGFYSQSDIDSIYQTILEFKTSAATERNNARDEYNNASGRSYYVINDWTGYQNGEWGYPDSPQQYTDAQNQAYQYAANALEYANLASGAADAAIAQYNTMIANDTDTLGLASQYKNDAISYAQEAYNYYLDAIAEGDKIGPYILSSQQYYNNQS